MLPSQYCGLCKPDGGSRPAVCYAGHVGSYDDQGLFVPDGMEEFVATLEKLDYEQLGTVAAQCIHRMQELGKHNVKESNSPNH